VPVNDVALRYRLDTFQSHNIWTLQHRCELLERVDKAIVGGWEVHNDMNCQRRPDNLSLALRSLEGDPRLGFDTFLGQPEYLLYALSLKISLKGKSWTYE
jgi:hypothetical protein